ncbi:glycosyltransferase [Wenzhouxiangella sp. XN79A]|uniref:glycosyltransferase family 39 protein n=1 Tax=Wenzhouxiangella sp. XN79A TaxID=2724193 RepID=UPI00144AFA6A|nr:glycosyltransferase family 39 protein [Wenzhouxiangella sp. XN79A]NKI34513.1 glycosyltransferase [Wenzhouxiangella sp. XN79A]
MSSAAPPAPAPDPAFELTVIVPTWNEVETVGRLLDALLARDDLPDATEILVVDDASDDGTQALVSGYARRGPVRLLEHEGPRDLTASVLAGARSARGRFCVVMDADGSHPADRVAAVLEPVRTGRADVAVGSRHAAGGDIDNWPAWRRAISRGAALLAWPFTSVRDPMSGFFATTTERLASLEPATCGYKVLLELLLRTRPAARVEEVPFTFHDRAAGESKMTMRVQWLFLRRLAAFGGARMSGGNMARFGLVGLSGVAVDLAVFWLLTVLGAGLASAHTGSFLVATLSNFALNALWSFRGDYAAAGPALPRYFRFLTVALLALALRGGVLAALVYGLGIPAAWAIAPAVALTAVINYLGSIFYVFPAADRPDAPALRDPTLRWRLAALGLIAVSLLLRALYLGRVDLIPDEMYYWVYTLHPALSYLDHPPLTAWLIAVGTALAGDTVLGVRLPLLLLAPLSLVFAYRYGRSFGDKTTGLLSAMLVATVPAWLATGFLMTTDAALITAWLGALVALRAALFDGRTRYWWAVGAAMGIGALAKYVMVFLAPGILLFMLLDRSARAQVRSPHLWGGVALACVLVSPVLVWNARNDWASFLFQSTRRIEEDPSFAAHLPVLHTLVMLLPLAGLVALLVAALPRLRRFAAPAPRSRRFMLALTLGPLAVFIGFAAFTPTKFHWIVPVWLAMLPMLAATVHPAVQAAGNRPVRPAPPRLVRGIAAAWRPVLPLSLILAGAGMHYVALGLPGVPWQEHRLGYLGWPEIAVEVHALETELEAETGQRPIVVGLAKWGIAAALSFHDVDDRRENITARNLVGMGGSQWERWFDPDTDPTRPVLLVSHETKVITKPWLVDALIGLGPLQTRPVYRDGRKIQQMYWRVARGFRPEQLRYPGQDPAKRLDGDEVETPR